MKKDLISAINIFYKEATLLGDVAHRAMYSIIPGGKFDLLAARWVASGAIDILYYGTKEVVKEISYYNGEYSKKEEIRNINLEEVNMDTIDTYINVLKKSVLLFGEENWDRAYGGKSWEKITTTLFHIASKYKTLLDTIKGSEKEEKLLRELIVDLNIFDGLCHNNGSIYTKMIGEESSSLGGSWKGDYAKLQKIERIRHLTELENPKHLYKEIRDLLYPKRIYQEYERELKKDPKFYENEDIEEDVKIIAAKKRMRLRLSSFVSTLNKLIKMKVCIDRIDDASNIINSNNVDKFLGSLSYWSSSEFLFRSSGVLNDISSFINTEIAENAILNNITKKQIDGIKEIITMAKLKEKECLYIAKLFLNMVAEEDIKPAKNISALNSLLLKLKEKNIFLIEYNQRLVNQIETLAETI